MSGILGVVRKAYPLGLASRYGIYAILRNVEHGYEIREITAYLDTVYSHM